MSKFQDEVVKRLEPKTKKDVAVKIEKLSRTALQGQISALESSIVLKEMAVEEAEEAVEEAFYPTTVEAVKTPQDYVTNLVTKRKVVKKLNKELAEMQELIETFKTDLKSFE